MFCCCCCSCCFCFRIWNCWYNIIFSSVVQCDAAIANRRQRERANFTKLLTSIYYNKTTKQTRTHKQNKTKQKRRPYQNNLVPGAAAAAAAMFNDIYLMANNSARGMFATTTTPAMAAVDAASTSTSDIYPWHSKIIFSSLAILTSLVTVFGMCRRR